MISLQLINISNSFKYSALMKSKKKKEKNVMSESEERVNVSSLQNNKINEFTCNWILKFLKRSRLNRLARHYVFACS